MIVGAQNERVLKVSCKMQIYYRHFWAIQDNIIKNYGIIFRKASD